MFQPLSCCFGVHEMKRSRHPVSQQESSSLSSSSHSSRKLISLPNSIILLITEFADCVSFVRFRGTCRHCQTVTSVPAVTPRAFVVSLSSPIFYQKKEHVFQPSFANLRPLAVEFKHTIPRGAILSTPHSGPTLIDALLLS